MVASEHAVEIISEDIIKIGAKWLPNRNLQRLIQDQ